MHVKELRMVSEQILGIGSKIKIGTKDWMCFWFSKDKGVHLRRGDRIQYVNFADIDFVLNLAKGQK